MAPFAAQLLYFKFITALRGWRDEGYPSVGQGVLLTVWEENDVSFLSTRTIRLSAVGKEVVIVQAFALVLVILALTVIAIVSIITG